MADTEEKPTLREWREKRALTTLELAAKAHVSITTVLGLEAGDRSPNIATAQKLTDALGITLLDVKWPEPEETEHRRRMRRQNAANTEEE